MPTQLIQARRKSRSISSFLKKTYEILEDSHNSYAIRWSDSGVGFIVVKEQQFSKQILPQYFKHSNYSSFVRQLNMYNFHKIRQANSQSHFHHQCFRRNNKALLSEIKRKPEKKKRKNQDQSEEIKQQEFEHYDERSDISMKNNLSKKLPSSKVQIKLEKSEMKIKSLNEGQKKHNENTHHIFKSEKENQGQYLSSTFSNKCDGRNHSQVNQSKQRVSIQNILVGSVEEDDKVSINNQMEMFPRYPTKEIFCPSNNNIYPFPISFKGNVISQFNILF